MKYLAYTIYVVTVLLISGFARANAATLDSVIQAQYQVPVNITEVGYNISTEELAIAGTLPNPCFGTPGALLIQDPHTPNVLVVRLSSHIPMNACVALVKNFETIVDLTTLAQASRLPLDPKAAYLLKLDGTDFQVEITGAQLLK